MKKLFLVLAVACIVAAPGLSSAQQLFDYNGQAIVPGAGGGSATAYLPIDEAGVIDTPLALDFANYDYTIVVVTGISSVVGGTTEFLPGTITIYEDNATVADYGDPSTFTDGTVILSGSIYDFSITFLLSTLGSGLGSVDWTGGTRIDEFAPADRTGWAFVVTASTRSTVLVPGYDQNWDGKVEPLEPVVDTEESSISEMKTRH